MTDRRLPNRDRDDFGKPHNARPRDALGRPLPRDRRGTPREEPDYSELTSSGALELAQNLLDRGRPFEAHEVLEAMWKRAPTPKRALWQGLAQLAVAITHLLRGNMTGADRLLRRARSNLLPYVGAADDDTDLEVDVDAAVAWTDRLLDRLEGGRANGGPPLEVQPPRLAMPAYGNDPELS